MNRDHILAELVEFASIPSVSAGSTHRAAIDQAAEWVAAALRRAGFRDVEVLPTQGNPVVYAAWTAKPGAPTILVYGHYDVQSADPAEEWTNDPFCPSVRNGRIYGRGVSDDKGPLLIAIKAAEVLFRSDGELPINVRFLVEGEEECGSLHLEQFIQRHARRLAADFVLSADGAMWRIDEPSITIASRGLLALAFTLIGPSKDLHSGRHGGGVANPLNAIAALVAGLHDAQGRVAVKGFYDNVPELSQSERDELASLPFDEARYWREVGAAHGAGEAGYTLLERQWARPTLDLNGLWGGYNGEGSKTVIPSRAHAKISCRLVPDQDPHDIFSKIVQHLTRHAPAGTRIIVEPEYEAAFPYSIPATHIGLLVAEQTLQDVYGSTPLKVRMGATLPVCALFRQHLQAETILFSFSTADEDFHAPNEFFRLNRIDEGITAWTRYWRLLAMKTGAVAPSPTCRPYRRLPQQ